MRSLWEALLGGTSQPINFSKTPWQGGRNPDPLISSQHRNELWFKNMIVLLYKDYRMLPQHIFYSHHNLFLSRSGAVNEQVCICIVRLQNIVPVNDK